MGQPPVCNNEGGAPRAGASTEARQSSYNGVRRGERETIPTCQGIARFMSDELIRLADLDMGDEKGTGRMNQKTVFERIMAREIPAEIVLEDEDCIAIRDIHPQAPVHLLLVPKRPIPDVAALRPEDERLMGHLWLVVQRLAHELNLADGYRVVLNNGRHAGQEVPHLHFHILAGRGFTWPPG